MSDVVARLSAVLADRYRIERQLGAGGMATVYLAHDVRHDRKVALKVLRPELSAILGADRFLHEIKTTANLQHPHIVPLHDSGEAGGQVYYVMPYVEGESLRDRLERDRQLPVDEALRIAREVADALEYAHQHHVVHRDIKPENILLHGGHAQVADFGIALAASQSTGGVRMTETGMSLGTPHYMSPEQAMGEREITSRSDIYALGVVLYEMLTGEPPFSGATAQAVFARVLTEPPRPITLQRHTVPANVEGAILQALEKLPADRFATAAEFAKALGDPTFHGTGYGPHGTVVSSAHRPGSLRARAGTAALIVAPLLAVLTVWGWWFNRPPPAAPVRYSMGLPPGQEFRQGVLGVNIAISPDGKRIVYLGNGEGATAQLWIRSRDQLNAVPLPGTEGAASPVFSPDGRQIAFQSGATFDLKVVPVDGGPPVTLAGQGSGGGVAWSDDGWIYFDAIGGTGRIRAEGGTPELVIPFDTAAGVIGHAWVDPLPNGRGVLFRSRQGTDPTDFELFVFDLTTGTRHLLTKGLIARYVDPGILVLVRADGAVLAARFDPDLMALTGPQVPLFSGVSTKTLGSADFAVGRNGTLIYVPGSASGLIGVAELVSVGRNARATTFDPPITFNPPGNRSIALSPDDRQVAIGIETGQAPPGIWIKQLPDGPLSRLTVDSGSAFRPSWSSDNRTVYYLSTVDSGIYGIWRRRADGSAPRELVWHHPGLSILEASPSRDGRWLIYRATSPEGGNRDIYGVRPGLDTAATPLVTGPAREQGPALSPDDRWLAYSSNETGRDEVYVRPFPTTQQGRWQVSTQGGMAPTWSRDGRELYFSDDQGTIYAVPIRAGTTFSPGIPETIIPSDLGLIPSAISPLYAPTRDRDRFLALRLVVAGNNIGQGQMIVVDNWFTELFAKMVGAR